MLRRTVLGAMLFSLLPLRRSRAVTSQQVQQALPLYEGLLAIGTALTQIAAANGTNGISSFTVALTDAEGNGAGQITVNIPLSPTNAAPLFTAMSQQLTTLQTAMQTQMGGI